MKKSKNLEKEFIILKEKLKDQTRDSKKTKENIKILYKEVEEKNRKLETLDQLKSQFVANVAHEFKNPLIIIKETMNLFLDKSLGSITDEQKEVIVRGKKTLERLIRLVTDLLDLAKIESGRMSMKREEVNLAFIVEELLALYEREFSKKEITFKKHIASGIGLIWADKDKISEVVTNLLSNAIKYTPKKGSVKIDLIDLDREVRFEISDTGPGISKKDAKKIFDKFERVTAEKEEGTGLGLPIARDIIRLHKGRIWVESEAGKGSKFIFTLPKSLREHEE